MIAIFSKLLTDMWYDEIVFPVCALYEEWYMPASGPVPEPPGWHTDPISPLGEASSFGAIGLAAIGLVPVVAPEIAVICVGVALVCAVAMFFKKE